MRFCILKSVAKFLLKVFIKDFMNTCYQGLGKAPKHSDYHLFGSLLEIWSIMVVGV